MIEIAPLNKAGHFSIETSNIRGELIEREPNHLVGKIKDDLGKKFVDVRLVDETLTLAFGYKRDSQDHIQAVRVYPDQSKCGEFKGRRFCRGDLLNFQLGETMTASIDVIKHLMFTKAGELAGFSTSDLDGSSFLDLESLSGRSVVELNRSCHRGVCPGDTVEVGYVRAVWTRIFFPHSSPGDYFKGKLLGWTKDGIIVDSRGQSGQFQIGAALAITAKGLAEKISTRVLPRPCDDYSSEEMTRLSKEFQADEKRNCLATGMADDCGAAPAHDSTGSLTEPTNGGKTCTIRAVVGGYLFTPVKK